MQPSLLQIYRRNIEVLAFQKNLAMKDLAEKLNINVHALTRVRSGRSKFIDPDMMERLMEVFNCTPDKLLTCLPGVEYETEERDTDG